jgi:hypothetical protein
VTAFLLLGVAIATAQAPQHALPTGSAVVFVADGHLDLTSPAGSTASAHLRDPLVLDGVTIAAAGTKARLLGGSTLTDGKREVRIALDQFTTVGGILPVKLVLPLPAAVDAGTVLEARTMAIVEHVGDRYSIRIPFPFPLSADKPAAYYTPTPARTASPASMSGRRRGSPAPPTPTASPSAAASASANPGAGGASPLPTPAATKIP